MLTLDMEDAAATDSGHNIGLECIEAAAPAATPDGRETAGPSAYAALSGQDRRAARRLFLAQNALAAFDDRRRHDDDHARLAPGGADCGMAAAELIETLTAAGDNFWTVERISAARLAASGWGQVLHDMYEADLLDMEKMLSVWNSDGETLDAATPSDGLMSTR